MVEAQPVVKEWIPDLEPLPIYSQGDIYELLPFVMDVLCERLIFPHVLDCPNSDVCTNLRKSLQWRFENDQDDLETLWSDIKRDARAEWDRQSTEPPAPTEPTAQEISEAKKSKSPMKSSTLQLEPSASSQEPSKHSTSSSEPSTSLSRPSVSPTKSSASLSKPPTSPSKPSTSPSKPSMSPSKPPTSPSKLSISPSKPSTSPSKPSISPSKPSTSPIRFGMSPPKSPTSPSKVSTSPLRSSTPPKRFDMSPPKSPTTLPSHSPKRSTSLETSPSKLRERLLSGPPKSSTSPETSPSKLRELLLSGPPKFSTSPVTFSKVRQLLIDPSDSPKSPDVSPRKRPFPEGDKDATDDSELSPSGHDSPKSVKLAEGSSSPQNKEQLVPKQTASTIPQITVTAEISPSKRESLTGVPDYEPQPLPKPKSAAATKSSAPRPDILSPLSSGYFTGSSSPSAVATAINSPNVVLVSPTAAATDSPEFCSITDQSPESGASELSTPTNEAAGGLKGTDIKKPAAAAPKTESAIEIQPIELPPSESSVKRNPAILINNPTLNELLQIQHRECAKGQKIKQSLTKWQMYRQPNEILRMTCQLSSPSTSESASSSRKSSLTTESIGSLGTAGSLDTAGSLGTADSLGTAGSLDTESSLGTCCFFQLLLAQLFKKFYLCTINQEADRYIPEFQTMVHFCHTAFSRSSNVRTVSIHDCMTQLFLKERTVYLRPYLPEDYKYLVFLHISENIVCTYRVYKEGLPDISEQLDISELPDISEEPNVQDP